MFKKSMSILLAIFLIVAVFSGCDNETKNERGESDIIGVTDIEYYIPDVIDLHISFGFNVPDAYEKFNQGRFSNNGTYYIADAGNKVAYGVSKYFVNENDDYDMIRCKLDEIKSAEDIFEKLNYKISFLYQDILSKKMFTHASLLRENFTFEYDVDFISSQKIDSLDSVSFEGTMTVLSDEEENTLKIYGHTIWNKVNPILFYVIDFGNEEQFKEAKNNLDAMVDSFKAEPFKWAEEQAQAAADKQMDNTTEPESVTE